MELKAHPNWGKNTSASLPTPLEVDQLFNPDANQHMWMEQGLEEGDTAPPAYLSDPGVREGISAMLVLDRAEEEEHRLTAEASAMIQWLSSQLMKTKQVLQSCNGGVFYLCFVAHNR